MKLDKGRLVFCGSTLALAGVFFIAAVFAGRSIVISGHVFVNDALFGIDTLRNIQILTVPGFHLADLERSNVHPLFHFFVKPWAPLIQRVGITPGVSGIIVNAAAGAAALLLAAWYFRRHGLARLDAWLLTLLMASSATWVCMSAIPCTYIFSLDAIILAFILAHWSLSRPDPVLTAPIRWGREAAWLLIGLLNYGITVTNGVIAFLAYGFGHRGRRAWLRAVLYGALVLGLGVALTALTGSLLNIWFEKEWVVNPTFRGGTPPHMTLIALATPTLWTFIAPSPTLNPLFSTQGWVTVGGILQWRFSAFDWLLLALCFVLLVAAAWAALVDRDPVSRRLSAGLAAALAFHITMHRFYYHAAEGVFAFTPHSLFLVIGLLAPLAARIAAQPAPARTVLRVAIFLLALALAVRNYHYFFMLHHLIPLPK